MRHAPADGVIGSLMILWVGVAIGVAFLATPAKFLAPSLSLPVALDVGRHTFAIYNRIELGFLAVLVIMAGLGRRAWLPALFVPGIVLIAQALWLIPALDARVTLILAGQQPAASPLHALYIVAEGAKVGTLLLFGFLGGRPDEREQSFNRNGAGARGWRGRTA